MKWSWEKRAAGVDPVSRLQHVPFFLFKLLVGARPGSGVYGKGRVVGSPKEVSVFPHPATTPRAPS